MSDAPDFVSGDDRPEASEDTLEAIRNQIRRLRDALARRDDLEASARETSETINELRHRTVPDMMIAAQVDSLGLPAEGNLPGYDVRLKPYYKANIPRDGQDAAFEWLDNNGHGDLVKTQITVTLGRGDRSTAERVCAFLDKNGIPYDQKLSVPWQTLTAFVREQVEQHQQTPPLDVLGAVVGNIADMKERRDG